MVATFKWKMLGAVLLVPVLGLTTSCSTQSEPLPSSPAVVTEYESTNVGTGGSLIPIESSNVNMAGYDASTEVMTVLFDSGGLYEYYGVPENLWTDFVEAQPSPWSQVGYPRLVQDGYVYRKVAP